MVKIKKSTGKIRKFLNFKNDILTIPNLLTTIRILFVPVVIIFLWMNTPVMRFWAFIVYVVAAMTDFFDGFIARKFGSVSVSGKLLDPLADKFIVNLTLVLLASMSEITVWPVLVILCREFYIFGIRALALEHDLVIAADIFGKSKTFLQMLALPFFLVNHDVLQALFDVDWDLSGVGYFLIWASVVFSIISAFTYTRSVKRKIFGH